ncbi:MAG TPA: hypothetical protein VGI40_13675, partial [Pirellulaceae bacterium]
MAETFPRRVVGKRRFALGFWAWLAAGLGLLASAAISRQSEFAWLAVFPLLLAVTLKAFSEGLFEMQLSETSLAISEGRPISFDSIVRVKALSGNSKLPASSFPILIRHAAGHFVIPAKVDHPSTELLAFLRAQAPAYVLQLDPRLNEFLAKQEELFGDRVAIYVGENVTIEESHWSVVKAILATSFVCSVGGIAAYASGLGNDGALILGIISIVTFVVTGLITLIVHSRSHGAKNVETAGLVVSPGGLAMIQGDLIGELRWEEIRSAKLSK